MTQETHALYRFHDAAGQLLYVGITLNPGARWKAHSKDKPWWHDVARVAVEQHPNRQAVLEAEQAAIIAEKPQHNIVHGGTASIPAPTPGTRGRYFGNVRKLPSGRFQVRYRGPDGRHHTARTPDGRSLTFTTARLASQWLDRTHADIQTGRWQPPAPTKEESSCRTA